MISNSLLLKIFSGYNISVYYEDSFMFVKTDHTLIKKLIKFFKNHFLYKFDTLYDLNIFINSKTSTLKSNKFTVYYYLFSIKFNTRLILTSQIKSENVKLASLVDIFAGASWLEREVWDMFGIFFKNNKDLRRLLTDYGFKYNPLLKEYPLKGYVELKFNTSSAILQYVKVTDQQQPKIYDFKNPWKFFY